jgi:hypothetical protein
LINSNGAVSFKLRENDDNPNFRKSMEDIKNSYKDKGLEFKANKISITKKM